MGRPIPRRTLLLVLAAAAFALLYPFPRWGRAVGALTDLTHVALGAALAWGLAAARGAAGRTVGSGRILLEVTLVLAVLEGVQTLTGRSAEWHDLWAGVAGALAVLVLRSRRPASRPARWGVAGLLVVLGAALPLAVLYDAWRQRRAFPLLASAEDALELTRWTFTESEGRATGDHPTVGDAALRLALEPGQYPGASLGVPPDWRGHGTLALDAWLEGDEDLDVILQVADRDHDGTYGDRFHRTVTLRPGANTIEVALDDIQSAPVDRRIDLARMSHVQLFVNGLAAERVLHLDHVRLTK